MYLSEHVWFPSELLDVETNEELNTTLNNTQMPKVEYRKISVDDYSEYIHQTNRNRFLFYKAMQICMQ